VFDFEGLRFEVLRADARQIHVLRWKNCRLPRHGDDA
jgi:magnesium and cobalt transporter